MAAAFRFRSYVYDIDSVYTFDFYQHLLDPLAYELDLGVKRVKVSWEDAMQLLVRIVPLITSSLPFLTRSPTSSTPSFAASTSA